MDFVVSSFVMYFLTIAAGTAASSINRKYAASHQAAILGKDVHVRNVSTEQKLGFLCTIGETGFPILNAVKDNRELAVFAAGSRGRNGAGGRLVGLGHDAGLNEEKRSEKNSDRKLFFDNLFRWVSNNRNDSALYLFSLYHRPETIRTLRSRFKNVEIERFNSNHSETARNFASYNVVVITGLFSQSLVSKLENHLKGGGGLVIAVTNWWFGHKAKARLEPVNKVSREAGFMWLTTEFTYHDENMLLSARGMLGSVCSGI